MIPIPLVMDSDYSFGAMTHVLQVHSVGMFAPGLIVGYLIEWFGCIPIDMAGLLFLVASNVVMILGMDYWNFMLGMVLLGVGWNFSFISSTTLLTQTYTVRLLPQYSFCYARYHMRTYSRTKHAHTHAFACTMQIHNNCGAQHYMQ